MSMQLSHRHPELVSGSISRIARSKRWQPKLNRKINPFWVLTIDQIDFPLSAPVFKLFLARNRLLHPLKYLIVNKVADFVAGGEARYRIISVLPKSDDKIGSHTNIQRPIMSAGKDIDTRDTLFLHWAELVARWILKQVQHDEFMRKPILTRLLSGKVNAQCCLQSHDR